METFAIICLAAFIGMILALIFGGVMGLFASIAIFALGVIFYFLPTIIAIQRKHRNSLWIFLVNLFLGATVIGWLIALLWAFDFHKTIKDFMEFQKQKNAPKTDTVIEGEYTKEDMEN